MNYLWLPKGNISWKGIKHHGIPATPDYLHSVIGQKNMVNNKNNKIKNKNSIKIKA